MAKPTEVFDWATDTNQNTGPDQGTPTKLEPPSGFQAQGWISEAPLFAQYLNWLLYAIGQWLGWLSKPDAGGLKATGTVAYSGTISSTPTKLLIFGDTMPTTIEPENVVQPDEADDDILFLDAGVYEVHCNLITSAASASEAFTFELYLDGVATGLRTICSTGAGDTDLKADPHISGLLSVTASQVLDVRATSVGASKSLTFSLGSNLWARRVS